MIEGQGNETVGKQVQRMKVMDDDDDEKEIIFHQSYTNMC